MHSDVYCLYLYQTIGLINQGVLEKDIFQERFIMKTLTRHLKKEVWVSISNEMLSNFIYKYNIISYFIVIVKIIELL